MFKIMFFITLLLFAFGLLAAIGIYIIPILLMFLLPVVLLILFMRWKENRRYEASVAENARIEAEKAKERQKAAEEEARRKAVWEKAKKEYANGRYEKAFSLLNSPDCPNYAEKFFLLGEMCRLGRGTGKDDAQAAGYYERAAGYKNAAKEILLDMYCREQYVPEDMEGFSRMVSDLGKPALEKKLDGYDLERGRKLVELYFEKEDLPKALLWYARAAGQGDRECSKKTIELCLQYGSLGKNNPVRYDILEVALYRLPQIESDPAALEEKRARLQEILDGEQKEYNVVIQCRRLAKMEMTGSQLQLADWYYSGSNKYIEQDYDQAFYWYDQAANAGNAEAQYNLGFIWYWGKGREKDLEKALQWFERAAEKGHVNALYRCGLMYYNGEGTPQDRKIAKQWYELAAQRGHKAAAIALREQSFYCG